MSAENRNIYQIARENAGFTQEKAAELLDVSVESVRAYEGDKRIPPSSVVDCMISIYNAQWLAVQHIRKDAVGKMVVPEISIEELPTAVLKLLNMVQEFAEYHKDIINIASDGEISSDERPRWTEIQNYLDELNRVVIGVKYAKSRNLPKQEA